MPSFVAPIKPRWEYALHLKSVTGVVRGIVKNVDQKFFLQVFGQELEPAATEFLNLCLSQAAEHGIEILAFRIQSRAKAREVSYSS